MGHSITAIILQEGYNNEIASEYDLLGISLGHDLTLFHIDHYYSAYWQAMLGVDGFLSISVDSIIFPKERVLAMLMGKISGQQNPRYAIIQTDYFGGSGHQYANVFIGEENADERIVSINAALSFLDIKRTVGAYEFDTVGLGKFRKQPEYLEKYKDMADELGV